MLPNTSQQPFYKSALSNLKEVHVCACGEKGQIPLTSRQYREINMKKIFKTHSKTSLLKDYKEISLHV